MPHLSTRTENHIPVKLTNVCRVHLQIGPLFQENVCYLGILVPVNKTERKEKHWSQRAPVVNVRFPPTLKKKKKKTADSVGGGSHGKGCSRKKN
uniref:Uncharacterized protein n=1 Tax=Pundamilia nyererei TaxID=303518 RepID=A0A3B4EW23_9CICH